MVRSPRLCGRPENVPARMRSSARWMKWHTRLRWTRSSYGESIIRQITPSKGFHGSTKHLRESYEQGAREFGWSRRTHEPHSMKDGRLVVGWGLVTAT